ncbi:MAG: hypothetical protein H6Q72_4583 [Firmicutes bacterium]|nr:hypothetical protein [Bacillota bacterium]
MSIRRHNDGFAFEFGSTVTILTTAAIGSCHGRKVLKGIFTGVVLDEKELKIEHANRHVSVCAVAEYYYENDEPNDEHDKDYKPHEEEEYCKYKEHEKDTKPHGEEEHCKCKEHEKDNKPHQEEEYCKCKEHEKDNKPHKEAEYNKYKEHEKDNKSHEEVKYNKYKEPDKDSMPHNHKECDKWHKHNEDKKHCGQKHHEKEKNEEKFLILSLTCPSFPFRAGQIVHINIEEIVAAAVNCIK